MYNNTETYPDGWRHTVIQCGLDVVAVGDEECLDELKVGVAVVRLVVMELQVLLQYHLLYGRGSRTGVMQGL